jgi:hypothetical protein
MQVLSTVQLDGMLRTKEVSQTTKKQQTCAHRSTKDKRRSCEFDTLVGRKAVDDAERRRSDAFCVPLKIWSNTGTEGDAKEAQLTEDLPAAYSLGVCIRRQFTHECDIQVDIDLSASRSRCTRL